MKARHLGHVVFCVKDLDGRSNFIGILWASRKSVERWGGKAAGVDLRSDSS